MVDGEPQYYDVIGEKGMEAYSQIADKAGIEMPDAVLIKKEYKVDIQIESGLGFTSDGKKDSMVKIMEYIRGLAQEGYVTRDAVSLMVKKFLEIFQYGNVGEFMEAMESGDLPITETQLQKMRVALLETTRDMQAASSSARQAAPPSNDPEMQRIKEAMAQATLDAQGGGQPVQ